MDDSFVIVDYSPHEPETKITKALKDTDKMKSDLSDIKSQLELMNKKIKSISASINGASNRHR